MPYVISENELDRRMDIIPTKRFAVITPAKNGCRITLEDTLKEAVRVQHTTKLFQEKWEAEQAELSKQMIAHDDVSWELTSDESTKNASGVSKKRPLKFVGGVDISFVKGNATRAIAGLVVLNYPELELVWERHTEVQLTKPYISGFLAFREVEFLQALVSELQQERPDLAPDVIIVDGNGVLHQRGFGIACHLGVLTGVPTIGVAKKLLQVDGLQASEVQQLVTEQVEDQEGGGVDLVGLSGRVWGAAYKCGKKANKSSKKSQESTGQGKPVFVSAGHRVGLQTAVKLTAACSIYKMPEPVRQADLRSREAIRVLLARD
jgi:DnaJ family protein A protein 2